MPHYAYNIFINCPFDDEYRDMFNAIVFAVHDCGYTARCAKETDDSGQVRIEKIYDIIKNCKYSIHDISRTEPDTINRLPRFNMPLELGIFLGAKKYGSDRQKEKVCKILDFDKHRYQKYCSDIAGQDISAHNNDPSQAITRVRDWIRGLDTENILPSGLKINERYEEFKTVLPAYYDAFGGADKLPYVDFRTIVIEWLSDNSW